MEKISGRLRFGVKDKLLPITFMGMMIAQNVGQIEARYERRLLGGINGFCLIAGFYGYKKWGSRSLKWTVALHAVGTSVVLWYTKP